MYQTHNTIYYNSVMVFLSLDFFIFCFSFGVGWSFHHNINVLLELYGVILVIELLNA
jgi:hypothetical protein